MRHLKYFTALGLVLAASPAFSAPISFADFTPLAASVGAGSLPENRPFQLSSSSFRQETLNANDSGAQNGGVKLGDNWDMNTLNENGAQAGRYLFTPYETGAAGVRRLDVTTGKAETIVANGTQGFVAGDASRWTPFGTYLTAEESWGAGSTKGRLFEVTDPLAAAGATGFVERTILPRVSHEGLAFDADNNMYFIDEFSGGSIYKYVSSTPDAGGTFFDAGETFVLKVGAGGNTEALGASTWEKITNADGSAVNAGAAIALGVDGRLAADIAGATNFNRPEDLEIQTRAGGEQVLYFTATASSTDGAGAVFAIGLTSATDANVTLFANRGTQKRGTGAAVGNEFLNPDNLAIDSLGNIYIVEDQPGGLADIWFAYDIDFDGVAESLARWASLSTLGAEPTGLYFDPFNSRVAYVNVQHANSDVDRTIRITIVPEPESIGLLLGGLGLLGGMVKRRRA
ncbi:MAG: alkaline phosphatase PhoX [Alphaproteobacteria bacterium]